MGTVQNLSNKERRKHDRQSIQTEVILFNSKGLFRTSSLNVSVSGLLLQDQVPENMKNEEFDLIIMTKNKDNTTSRILLKAIAIENPGSETCSRVCFRGVVPQQLYKLQRLLGALSCKAA